MTSPYTKRSLDLWPWPIWLRQISSKQSHCWMFDFWDSRRCRYINYWGPLCPLFLFNNYIWPLHTPRGLLTLDPDLFGCAKFRKKKSHCWIFDFWDSRPNRYKNYWGPLCPFFLFNNYIWPLHTLRGLLNLTPTYLVAPNFVKTKPLLNFWFLRFPT